MLAQFSSNSMSSAEGGSDPACPELVNLVVAYYPKDYSEALKLQ